MKKEGLRVQTTIPAAPTTLYLAWLSSEQHGAMTGSTAKIDSTVGGKYSSWNGYISGKLVILDLGRRIVMSWRTTDFPRDAHDSRVEIHFEALGGSTRLTILHTEIPEGQGEKYKEGWIEKYFNPMRAFFSKFLPDPRKPPPPRRPIPPPDEEEEEDETRARDRLKLKGKAAPPPPSKKGAKAAPPAPPAKKAATPPPSSKKAAPPPPPAKKASPPPPAKKAPPPPVKKPAAAAKAAKKTSKPPLKPAVKKPAAKPVKKPAGKKR